MPGEASNGVNFVTLGQIGTGTYEVPSKIKGEYEEVEIPLLVNEYFVTHPEMMLGTVMTAHDAGSGGLYGGDSQTLVARPGSTLDMELADAVTKLPENILEETRNMIAETESNNDKPKLPRKRTGELSVKTEKSMCSMKKQQAKWRQVRSNTTKRAYLCRRNQRLPAIKKHFERIDTSGT